MGWTLPRCSSSPCSTCQGTIPLLFLPPSATRGQAFSASRRRLQGKGLLGVLERSTCDVAFRYDLHLKEIKKYAGDSGGAELDAVVEKVRAVNAEVSTYVATGLPDS